MLRCYDGHTTASATNRVQHGDSSRVSEPAEHAQHSPTNSPRYRKMSPTTQ
eukprot:m.203578 g.203578  ORF g.203578 m.203578 type:complete len:51 (+) comp18854_c1_seq1:1152-1304(+)